MNISLIKNLEFYKNLSNSEQDELINSSKELIINKNEIIHQRDTDCKGIIIVEQGSLRAYVTSPEGREVTLFTIENEDTCILSASCLMDSIDFDILIDAIKDTKAILIPSYYLSKLTNTHKEIELYLYKESTNKFSEVMYTIQEILFMGIDQRIANYLWDESIRQNSLIISTTHEEIAKSIGSSREVITRGLKYLSKQGMINITRGKIEIVNKELLKNSIK